MADRRLLPGWGLLAVLMLIAGALAVATWWFNRPRPNGPPSGPALEDLDVICAGRVDGLLPTAGLEPAMPGKVSTILVQEGATVEKDAILLQLEDSAARFRLAEAIASRKVAEVELQAAEKEVQLYPTRVKAYEALVAAASARVEAAKQLQQLRRTQLEFNKISPAEFAAGEAEVRQLLQIEAAENERFRELKDSDPSLRLRLVQARKELAEIAVQAAEKALADCQLKAPVRGTVLRIQTSVGETVTPGGFEPPIIFRPEGALVVRAELEQEFLGRVHEGMPAKITDETRPRSPVWTGSLARISGWVARRRSIVLEPGELNDVRTVECLVTLDDLPEPLLVGQRVRVRFSRSR